MDTGKTAAKGDSEGRAGQARDTTGPATFHALHQHFGPESSWGLQESNHGRRFKGICFLVMYRSWAASGGELPDLVGWGAMYDPACGCNYCKFIEGPQLETHGSTGTHFESGDLSSTQIEKGSSSQLAASGFTGTHLESGDLIATHSEQQSKCEEDNPEVMRQRFTPTQRRRNRQKKSKQLKIESGKENYVEITPAST